MKRKKLKRRHYTIGFILILFVSALVVYLFSIFKPPPTNPNKSSYTANAAGPFVWQQFDGNEGKTGINNDPFITKSNVSSLKKIWSVPISSDGSPVYLSSVTTSQGVKNLVFVTTTNGGLDAIDDTTGKLIWSKTTTGNAGITTSSPAIDPNNLFIYNYGKDGKVHKYDIGTGNEETSGGWPLTATLLPTVEKGSSALAVGDGNLYVTTSAYVGDNGQYVGHIVAKNLTSGAVSVFNMACSNTRALLNGNCPTRQSGVWARPGIVVDTNTSNIFISSGNGLYAPPNNLGDSIVELSPDLSKIIDTYTPTNFQQLQDSDADLGSADVAVIPSLELGIQGGKDNKVRVLNLKNLSGLGGPNHTGGELQTLSVNCNIFSLPISWTDGSGTIWVFVTDMCNNLYAYKVVNNRLQQVYAKNGSGGSSPLMVNGMLFIQTNGAVRAVDPATGTLLWTGAVGSMHWQSPAVINGHIFVIDNSNLTSFAVSNTTPTIANPTPSGFVCLGSCPTPTSNLPSSSPSTISPIAATPVLSVNPTNSLNPTVSPNPCAANNGIAGIVSTKTHQHTNAGISNIVTFLLQLLLLLFQFLLGGGNIGTVPLPNITPTITPTITPCVTP